MVNKHTVNYHPSPWQLISRIHTVMFLWTPKGFISPESFLNFFLNLYIPLWLRKSFKFILLRLLQIHLWVKKIESVHFYSCHQAKLSPRFLSLSRRETGIAYSSRTAFLEFIFSWGERGERIMELKKTPKLTKVSVTSFYKFHHLCNLYIMVYVLLCNNLTSSMLKCEGSLTLTNKTFPKKYVQEWSHEIYNLAPPYFQLFHPPHAKLNLFPYIFFLILKGSIPLFYQTNKRLWYRPNNYGIASKAT